MDLIELITLNINFQMIDRQALSRLLQLMELNMKVSGSPSEDKVWDAMLAVRSQVSEAKAIVVVSLFS